MSPRRGSRDFEADYQLDLTEKPLPPMPHRMKSNATFQPKNVSIMPNFEIQQDKISSVEKDRQSVDDRLSRVAKDYRMAVKNKERMAALMDILSNDDRNSKKFINLLNDTRSIDYFKSNDQKSSRLPSIKKRDMNSIESGQADIETGLLESSAIDKTDTNSFHVLKKSIDLSYENRSMNSSFISHEPNKFAERNNQFNPANRYKNKITSQSQISGGRDNVG